MFAAMKNKFGKKVAEEKGATAVEYGMIVGLIAAVIVAIIVILGPQIGLAFQKTSTELSNAGLNP